MEDDDCDLIFALDFTIVASNDGAEWLSTDDRVTWSRHGYFEVLDGADPSEIIRDARAAGLTARIERPEQVAH
jgi:hypothetical protein